MHHKVFDRVPGFYALDANSTPHPLPDDQMSPGISNISWRDKIAPPLIENQDFNFTNRLIVQSSIY